MSQTAIFKQNSYEKYVRMLLGFGETNLENLLAYLQCYNKSMGQIKSLDIFIRKLQRLVQEFNYELRTVLDIDELSIIMAYFEDVLNYIVEILFAAKRKHEFDKDLSFCYETLELFAKVVNRYSFWLSLFITPIL